MRVLAHKARAESVATAPYQQIGHVVRVIERKFHVRTSTDDVTAQRAVSCLVEPAVGDRVLVVRSLAEERTNVAAYILAVLERTTEEPVQIETHGDTRWAVRDGGFAIAAEGPVDLVSKSALSLVAQTASVLANEGVATLGTLTLAARSVLAEAESMKIAADWVDSAITRVSERIRRYYRVVEEIEQVRAGQVDVVAKKNLTMRAANTLLHAKTLAKLNAGQVHIG